MPRFKFIKECDPNNRFDFTKSTMEFEAITIDQVMEALEDFLLSCGFHPETVAAALGNEEEVPARQLALNKELIKTDGDEE